jgi:DNA-binding GntR family transcriptional regulator
VGSRNLIRDRTLGNSVARTLREAIYHRQLPSGTRLIDSELAGQLDVSRGTVRNALRILTYEGIVESRPHRGYFVADPQPEQIIELLELRSILEARAAAAAVEHISNDDLDRLTEIAREIGSCCFRSSVERIRQLDIEFHTIVTRRCGKPLLLELWSSLNSRLCMLDVLCATVLNVTSEDSARRHFSYIDALRSRDRDRAYEAGVDHYQYLISRYERQLAETGQSGQTGAAL